MGTDVHNPRNVGVCPAKLRWLHEKVDTPRRQESTSREIPKWPTLAGRLCQLREERIELLKTIAY